MKVAFRVDASHHLGSGHVLRCATLAASLREKGASIIFLCRLLPGDYCDWLEERGFAVERLSAPLHDSYSHESLPVELQQEIEEVSVALHAIGQIDWLITDHYALDVSWERAMRAYTKKIMVIDDLANREHDADLLLDQNLHSNMSRYDDLVSPTCRQLLGAKFALLRPEFTCARHALRQRNGRVNKVLVFMGGGDVRNVTGKVLSALLDIEIKDLHIDVVLTLGNPSYQELKAVCDRASNCTLHVQTADMAGLMTQADLMIGGSGSATWERCCLGLPSVLMSIAENQRAIGQAVSNRHSAIYIGDDSTVNIDALRRLISSLSLRPALLRGIGSRAFNLVDGRGVQRVAAALMQKFCVTVVSDEDSWINQHLAGMVETWRGEGHSVNWVHDVESIQQGDCAFFLSFSKIANLEILRLNTHNLVVHESDLPRGRGWSPLTWQIIEGKNCISVTLLEADITVDAGVIYDKEIIKLSGGELINELRQLQADVTVRLCCKFLKNYPFIVTTARKQIGQASYYPRRRPQDSQLNPNRSIAEQFNLLRVVDNKRYPAFFEWAGNKYFVHITKTEEHEK